MRWIAIVADHQNLTADVAAALPENAEIKIFSPAEIERETSRESFLPPDLLIVDFSSVLHHPRRLFTHLSYYYPELPVIGLTANNGRQTSAADLAAGVDEIIALPVNDEQKRRLRDCIVQCLAHRDGLLAMQKLLHHNMNRGQIVARSKPMREIFQRLPELAAGSATVLITGETGAGKELFARALHYLGPHAAQPFITVDCGAMPDHLVENELFGHARGAYTDAGSSAKGLIQEADGGTLFLDEVEALPLNVQAKFLRFLQERQYKPLGQSKYVAANVRVVAATNIDLAHGVAAKTFREDLYYRLNVVPLLIPPLRARKSDIPALARFFLQRHGRDRQAASPIPEETLQRWMEYDWPGNVRELENKVQQWLAHSPIAAHQDQTAFPSIAPQLIRSYAAARQETLVQFERAYLQKILTHTKGNLSAAARLAEADRKHLRELLKKHGLEASFFR
jgi:DNA-binding NtrC family response regulator